jgi:hypothetical protein
MTQAGTDVLSPKVMKVRNPSADAYAPLVVKDIGSAEAREAATSISESDVFVPVAPQIEGPGAGCSGGTAATSRLAACLVRPPYVIGHPVAGTL